MHRLVHMVHPNQGRRLIPRYYLRYVWKGQPDYDKLREIVFTLICKFPPTQIIVENKEVGRSLLSQLRNRLGDGVVPFEPTESKKERIKKVLYTVHEGRVFLPKKRPDPRRLSERDENLSELDQE